MRLVDLSHTIVSDMAQWPGDRQPLVLHRQSRHGPESHMSSSLEMGCHVGTHIDAPLHFLAGQPGLDALSPERFAGRGLVVSVPATDPPVAINPEVLDDIDLSGVDFVLLATGWSRHWGTPTYFRHWPWLSPELAERLATANLKGVGLDTPSLDPFDGQRAHEICAAAGLINIENLTGLEAVVGRAFRLLALPLKLDGTEASPVRAVAWVDDSPAFGD